MTARKIETLLRTDLKKELITFEMKKQKKALKGLTGVANQLLGENQIDMDVFHDDTSIEYHLFEAFFSVPNIKGVVLYISTNGLPEVSDDHKLFLDLYYKSSKGIKKLIEIHTAKLPDKISD